MSHDLFDQPDNHWEDREAAKKVDGKFANRIYVQPLGDGMVRINFGEVLDEDPSYHTAIVVTAERAVEFAQLIYEIGNTVVQVNKDSLERLLAEARGQNATKQF